MREGSATGRSRVHLVNMAKPNFGLCGVFVYDSSEADWSHTCEQWAGIMCKRCLTVMHRMPRPAPEKPVSAPQRASPYQSPSTPYSEPVSGQGNGRH